LDIFISLFPVRGSARPANYRTAVGPASQPR
jgi:hypothetical protein